MNLTADSVLRKRSNRFFLILLPVYLSLSSIFGYTHVRIIHPNEWYYVTTSENHVDIRADDNNSKIALGWGDRYKVCFERNDAFLPTAEYRSVLLCNIANLEEVDFLEEYKYFMTIVDEDYQEYNYKYFELFMNAILIAIGAWIASIAAFKVYRWILAGS